MAKPFGKTNDTTQTTPHDLLRGKYHSARSNLLLAMAFTVINVVIAFFDGSSYFLFSLFVPYFLVLTGLLITGKLPAELYTEDWADAEFLDSSALVVMVVIAAVILSLYLLCWIFSKKEKVGWLIFALVLVSIDTALMLLIQGVSVDTIIDIAFHAWVIISLINGIGAYRKLKKLPDEVVTVEAANVIEGTETEITEDTAEENTSRLRIADSDVKCNVLLTAEKDGLAITYRRVKRTNELIVNGNVYDEYEALIESSHILTAVVNHHTVEAGFDGVRSFISVDGERIAKKLRLR